MTKVSLKILIFFACVFLNSNAAWAWDEIGHKLTTYIAWEQMTPDVREKVIKILLDAPEDSDLSVHYDAFNSRSEAIKKRELFMYASIWSDVVRNRQFDVRYKKYNQGDWHYGAIFWKQENGIATVLKDFPEPSGKAIPKLTDFEEILKDSSYKEEEKALALAWFLHIGGDIHNPLHNASRVTENSPKGDQGGNRFVLSEQTETQRRVNLHGYWDGIIGFVKPRKNDDCDADYLSPIARRIIKKYPYSKLQSRLKLGEYEAWNLEGFNLLNEVVYRDITRNQMPSKKYRKRTFNVASEQLALAGYRLGESLNRIFSEKAEEKKEADKISDDGQKNDNSSEEKQNAVVIWEKVLTAIGKEIPIRFVRVEITDAVVTIRGIVGSLEQKQKAYQAAKNVKGVRKVIDLMEVDESLLQKETSGTIGSIKEIKSSKQDPSECKIIRKVLYPVSKRRTPDQKLRIALLDICPPNRGMVARPMTSLMVDGEIVMYEYDVTRVFENEKEARKYAQENKIKDMSFE